MGGRADSAIALTGGQRAVRASVARAWTLLVFLRGTQFFFLSQNLLIITITHLRKPFCCDPVVAKYVAVIIFGGSLATNTSKS